MTIQAGRRFLHPPADRLTVNGGFIRHGRSGHADHPFRHDRQLPVALPAGLVDIAAGNHGFRIIRRQNAMISVAAGAIGSVINAFGQRIAMKGVLVVLLNLFMAAAAGGAVAASLLVDLMTGMAFITDIRRAVALGKGGAMNGGGNLLGPAFMTILAGCLGMRLTGDAVCAAMTTDAIGRLCLTRGASLSMWPSVVGVSLFVMAILASALVPGLQRPQTVRPMAFHAGRGGAPVSAADQHFAHRLVTIQAGFLRLRIADHGMRFAVTAQTGGRVLPPLPQQLAVRAGIIDVFDILMASDAVGGRQRAGMRIVFDSG